MPDELNRLVDDIAYGVKRVVVAIGSRKDDDSKFHALAAPRGVAGSFILTQRVIQQPRARWIPQRLRFRALPRDLFAMIFLASDAEANSRRFFDAQPILFV